MKNGLTRRDFLKVTAAGAAGVATAGMLGASALAEKQVSDVPIQWDFEADAVILGLGGAGASAAIEAFDNGASVLVLEKQAEARHFSNSRMSGGVFHNPHPDGDRNARVEYVKAMMSGENCPWKMEGEQPHVSQEMAEMYADNIMEVANFLKAQAPDLDDEGMAPTGEASFPSFPYFAEAKYGATVRLRYKNFADADSEKKPYEREPLTKSSGEAYHWALVEQGIKEKRPEIRILYETPADHLLVDKEGGIIGVCALQNGKSINVKAKKGIVIATGGFEYNLKMRRAFLEGPGVKGWSFYGSPFNTGDGIRMGILVGAGLAKVAKCASRIEPAFPYGKKYEEEGLKQGANCAITASKNSCIVDNFGNRYADESIITDGTRPYRYQFYHEAVKYDLLSMSFSRDPSWIIFDETRNSAQTAVGSGSSVAYDFLTWGKDNSFAIEQGWILKADTLEELAAKIKEDEENRNMMDASTLVKTIARYNELCAKGVDEDYNRLPKTMGAVETAPFYAMKLYPGGPNTKGGLDADANRSVLDWEGKPIPRLYTAGEISSVFKFTYQAGGNLTEGIVCGRVAGKNVAALESWEK